jgi:AcrR family transcriptional regulator
LIVTKKPADSPSISSRRPNAERREESMTLILDHAEAEFAAKGYNGTTLASVAAIAGIDTSLMRYYFGDKEKLFAAVFRLRGPLINAARYKALDAYRQEFGDRGTLEGLIDAFVRPGFDMAQSDGHRNYAAIVAYVNSSRGAMHSLMSEVFDDVSKVLIADMQRLMPMPRSLRSTGAITS